MCVCVACGAVCLHDVVKVTSRGTSGRKNMPKYRHGDLRGIPDVKMWVVQFDLLGASIALTFDGPKRMESYKNEKYNILSACYK